MSKHACILPDPPPFPGGSYRNPVLVTEDPNNGPFGTWFAPTGTATSHLLAIGQSYEISVSGITFRSNPPEPDGYYVVRGSWTWPEHSTTVHAGEVEVLVVGTSSPTTTTEPPTTVATTTTTTAS